MIDSSLFSNFTSEGVVPASIFADRPLRLLEPEDFPNSDWTSQRTAYELNWAYYKGYVLNKKAGDQRTLLYPVKLNIVRPAVIDHAAVMLGQFEDNDIVKFGLRTGYGFDEEVDPVTKASNLFWSVNDGDEILLEQSLMAMIFGGTFWKIAWTPTRLRWPIRIFAVDPRAVFAIWDGQDTNRLVSIDVNYQLPRPVASARYRVDLSSASNGTEPAEYVSIHEHWDEQEFYIKIDEQIGKWPNGQEMAGPNHFIDPIFGAPIIPFVYQPRLRVGDGMYGEPLPPGLMGPQNEINNNLAHLSEGLADAMHQQPWIKNRAKGTSGLDRPRNEWIDLGMQQHGTDAPEVGRLKGADLTPSMVEYVTENLVKLAREHVSLPDVAWGRTDSSIRSALTLKFMMWPTLNLGQRYRKSLATSLKWLMYRAFVITYVQQQSLSQYPSFAKLGLPTITDKMIEALIVAPKIHLPVMLPDDRVELVAEMVQRITSDMISPETAIRRLDGDDDIAAELNRIDEHRAKLSDLEIKLAEAGAAAKAAAFGNREGDSKPKSTSRQKQAEGGRKSEGSSK